MKTDIITYSCIYANVYVFIVYELLLLLFDVQQLPILTLAALKAYQDILFSSSTAREIFRQLCKTSQPQLRYQCT